MPAAAALAGAMLHVPVSWFAALYPVIDLLHRHLQYCCSTRTAIAGCFFRDALNCTVLAFALNTCAYTTEIFAGAIRAMPRGEVEAARALGFDGWKLYVYLVMPAVVRRSLPYYSNEVIFMLHSTTLAFTATVADLLKVARDASSTTFLTFESFAIAALLYLLTTFALVGLFRLAERRWLSFLGPGR